MFLGANSGDSGGHPLKHDRRSESTQLKIEVLHCVHLWLDSFYPILTERGHCELSSRLLISRVRNSSFVG